MGFAELLRNDTEINRVGAGRVLRSSVARTDASAIAQARIAADAARFRGSDNSSSSRRTDLFEGIIFWLFVAALAWTPFWYGSNDLVAWGINAVCFPGLAMLYEISLVIAGENHPIAIKRLAAPGILLGGVVAWICLQLATWPSLPFVHPVWSMAAEALSRPLDASISVDRDLSALALVRLLTVASAFWLAVQLCRDAGRAIRLVESIAGIGVIYAAYGLLALAFPAARLPWLHNPVAEGFVTSTFINHNSYATYAGLTLIAMVGLTFRLYRRETGKVAQSLRLELAALIETTGRAGGVLLAGGLVILVSLLLTGSRGGVLTTGFGLFAFVFLTSSGNSRYVRRRAPTILFAFIAVVATVFVFGDVFVGNLTERGITDADRLSVYALTLRSIFDAPIFGYGYGTFADVFPVYRDHSIGVQGTWLQAHDTYLEAFQGLGLIFGSMFVASVALPVLRCVKAAAQRQGRITAPGVAAGAAVLVGGHALVDFSLQIQAVALTFAALLGAGVAQSEGSRLSLAD